MLEQAIPGNPTAKPVKLAETPGQRIQEKEHMGIRVTKIGTGQGAVHSPVIVDTISRTDKKQFYHVEQNQEKQDRL